MSGERFRLDGRVAVVTGAAGLLGREHCNALAQAGAIVYACDLSAKAAEHVAVGLGVGHVGVALDVTDEDSVGELRDRIIEEHGRVDVLVNNAALNDAVENALTTSPIGLETYPTALFRKVLDVNVTGIFLMSRTLGSVMARSGRGSIINIASTYGVVAPDQSLYKTPDGDQVFIKSAAYPTSKGAVVQLTRYIATYWGSRGVRANCLSPGGVENSQDNHFVDAYSKRTPLQRMASRTDFAGAVVFLASDASAYMTGANLIVDGGFTTW